MCEVTRFWLDWSVQVLVAMGTLGAVYAALFGDSFKARRVSLSVSIANNRGVHTPTRIPVFHNPEQPTYAGYNEGEARYYQLRVSNASRYFPAHHVDVYLLRVEQLVEGNAPSPWIGEIPLIWQHQDQLPRPRTVGNPGNVDLFAIDSEKELTLQPLVKALSLPMTFRGACALMLTVEARSDESNSPEVRILVNWDGQWVRDDEAMSRHVEFRIVET